MTQLERWLRAGPFSPSPADGAAVGVGNEGTGVEDGIGWRVTERPRILVEVQVSSSLPLLPVAEGAFVPGSSLCPGASWFGSACVQVAGSRCGGSCICPPLL